MSENMLDIPTNELKFEELMRIICWDCCKIGYFFQDFRNLAKISRFWSKTNAFPPIIVRIWVKLRFLDAVHPKAHYAPMGKGGALIATSRFPL
jgi:hypothetical protein